MFRDEFLFPAADHDPTYKAMVGKAMTSILREVEEECNLPSRTLGAIDRPGPSEMPSNRRCTRRRAALTRHAVPSLATLARRG